MGQPEQHLSALGKHAADLQDRAPEARLDRARGKARLLAAGAAPRSAGRPRAILLPIAAALGALAIGALALAVRPRPPLRFDTGTAEAGAVGAWIASPPGAARPIRFSDGSLLVLAPEGRARVTSVDADGAEVALERGALEVSVVHHEHTRWTLRSGPFQVHVVGTRFDLRWDADAERLEVALREGAITVSGPVVGDARAVRAGERLTISKTTLEVGSIDGATAAPPAPAPTDDAPPPAPPVPAAPVAQSAAVAPPAVRGHASAAVPTAAPATPDDAPGWRVLAHEARYKDALAAAEADGFDTLCGSASAGDLYALGDTARLGGNGARASQAFLALRSRFPGTTEAASAAFLLGRMAQDHGKDDAGAARWFTRYLAEQHGGAFVADAAGRLVEAQDRMGDAAGARRAAERYLAAYPNGAHAAYARSVLARGAGGAP
jgi:TolA-binding protein